jgi:hypothetical protein
MEVATLGDRRDITRTGFAKGTAIGQSMMIPSEQKFPWKFTTGVVLLATLVVLMVLAIGKLGVCYYDFKVTVTSASATPIKNVRGKAYYDLARAQEIAADPHVQFSMRDGETAFDGKSLRVVGLYSCRSYCLDLIETGAPPPFLVLLVDYADGKRENKFVEIPEGRSTRKIAVEVP